MTSYGFEVKVRSKCEGDVIDITADIGKAIAKSGIKDGIVCASVVGSTASLTTVEFEPGLVRDMSDASERLFPKGIDYEHHLRWGDGNGHSHVRASFLGPSVTIPVREGKPVLGTWQQIVLIEFDTRARGRTVAVQVVGD